MDIYLIRHGQTDTNLKKLVNGRNDEPLNENGIKQAESFINIIENFKIDLIICSPIARTKQTAQIINQKDIDIIYDDRIVEREMKETMYKPIEEISQDETLYKLDDYKNKRFEPFGIVYERVLDFLKDIKEKYEGKNILIISHGDILYAMRMILEKREDVRYPRNCEILKYKI